MSKRWVAGALAWLVVAGTADAQRRRDAARAEVVKPGKNPSLGGDYWKVPPRKIDKGRKPVLGYADLHTHPWSVLGFGNWPHARDHKSRWIGKQFMWGHPGFKLGGSQKELGDQLTKCNPSHQPPYSLFDSGSWELDPSTKLSRAMIVDGMEGHQFIKKFDGFPKFDYPRHNGRLHQQMHIEWIYRAYLGGLRLMVASTVHNQLLRAGWNSGFSKIFSTVSRGNNPQEDFDVSVAQLNAIKFVASQNKTWMQIVSTAAEARRAIEAKKLAIVLACEVDTLTPEMVVTLATKHGVRFATPIHMVDNAFGGSAAYSDDLNMLNQWVTGKWHRVVDGSKYDVGFTYKDVKKVRNYLGFRMPLSIWDGKPLGYHKFKSHMNAKGLTAAGKAAIERLMKLGVIIDVAHMGHRSTDDSLKIAEKWDMPLVFSHGGVRAKGAIERHLYKKHARRLYKLGGVLGLGTAESSTESVAKAYAHAKKWFKDGGIAFGTDVNGMEPQIHPRRGRNEVKYHNISNSKARRGQPPMIPSTMGRRTWTFNRDGTAHIGLFPDFLQDLRNYLEAASKLSHLMYSAEDFIRMWEKVDRNKSNVGRSHALHVAPTRILLSAGRKRALVMTNATKNRTFRVTSLRASSGLRVRATSYKEGMGKLLMRSRSTEARFREFERRGFLLRRSGMLIVDVKVSRSSRTRGKMNVTVRYREEKRGARAKSLEVPVTVRGK